MNDPPRLGRRAFASSVTALGAAALGAAALGTPAFGADDTLGEIVVTAQRRVERLQDVPEAITAISGDALNALHWQGTADLAKQVPSLSFDVLGPGESTLALRGLGTSYGLAPAVAFYINETPLDIRTDGYSGAPDFDFFDVDRVEVLRGPQGTLYGSSAMGGAVRILTAQPDPGAFAVNAEIGGSSVQGGGAGYFAKSAVNLPLTGDAAVRIVGSYEHVPGYIDRVAPGNYANPAPDDPVTARHINDANIKSGRILGLWKPTDGVTVKPTFMIPRWMPRTAPTSSAIFRPTGSPPMRRLRRRAGSRSGTSRSTMTSARPPSCPRPRSCRATPRPRATSASSSRISRRSSACPIRPTRRAPTPTARTTARSFRNFA